ncbi:MAG TPA: L-threonine 3-dehydrogenase, partial [Alphaproteobacteria bacterium]|nr:L-threonine 3-dehydrogenase [Alphaproteobacteria bacterium]
MKALAKLKPETGIWMIDDAPMPEIGPDDVLIKVGKTAICGTDIHIYNWDDWSAANVPTPMVVGHEYSGVV